MDPSVRIHCYRKGCGFNAWFSYVNLMHGFNTWLINNFTLPNVILIKFERQYFHMFNNNELTMTLN